MKKITILSLLAVCFAAISFTSCMNSDDNGYSALTAEQQKTYQTKLAMAGTFNDMVILFEHKNDADVKNQVDSVESYCDFSMYGDSTLRISNFPIAQLAEHISDKDLKEAIAKVEPRTVSFKYIVLPNSNQTTAVFYHPYPQGVKLNLTYGTGADAKSHEVILYFSYDTRYAGYCAWETKQLYIPFYFTYIYVDGKQTNYISNSTSSSRSNVAFVLRNKIVKKDNK